MSLIQQLLVTTAVAGIPSMCVLVAVLQQRALRRARYEASHDDTTGMPNRRAFLHHLQRCLHTGGPVGVVLLDLDSFKSINDGYGHQTGNDLLTAIGSRLTDLPTPVVLAARLSGDEFVLLVHGDREQTAAIARQAWRTTCQPVRVRAGEFTVYASVGYATAALGTSAAQLLHHADVAMYRAKTGDSEVVGADATSVHIPTATAAGQGSDRSGRAGHGRARDQRRHRR